jgi:hypothetical protein
MQVPATVQALLAARLDRSASRTPSACPLLQQGVLSGVDIALFAYHATHRAYLRRTLSILTPLEVML